MGKKMLMKGGIKPNTFIGGVGATVNSASVLASYLINYITNTPFSVLNIKGFKVVGSDIECYIGANFTLDSNAFSSNNSITYFKHTGDFYKESNINGLFANSPNLKVFEAKSLVRISENFMGGSNQGNVNKVYIPNVINFAYTTADDGCFRIYGAQFNSLGAKFYVNSAMQTINAGGVEGDLAYLISRGVTVRFVQNYNLPNSVTNLSAGTIYNTAVQLNFTPPSSTNTIEYYEVYVNGIYNRDISASGSFATNLIPETNYNISIIAVDIFYNKSEISNILNVTTNNAIAVDSDAIAYITASSNGYYGNVIDHLFTSLKSAGLYSKIQAFYPNIGTSAQQKFNAKNPLDTDASFRLTYSGSATFSNSGYTSNGSTGYANTNFIPSVNQNVTSNGLTIVVGTNNPAAATDTVEIGAFNNASQTSLISVKNNNTTFRKVSRMNGNVIEKTGVNDSRGVFTSVRNSTVQNLFRNNVKIATGTANGTLSTNKIFVGALNVNGNPYGNSNQRIQFVAIHEGLSDVEVATLHAIIDNFEAAIGRKTW